MISSFLAIRMDLFHPIPIDSLPLLPNLSSIINLVFFTTADDSILWMPSRSNEFTVNSYCKMLNDGRLRSAFQKGIWKCAVPLKVKIFAWLAIKDKILSRKNLAKRGWSGPLKCENCGSNMESVTHLFSLYCSVSKLIRNYFLHHVNTHLARISLSQTFTLKQFSFFQLIIRAGTPLF